MEVLEINDAIQEMILKSASEEEIYNEARKHGFMSMKEDAVIKALEHKISVEEMNAFGTKLDSDEMLDNMEKTVDNPTPNSSLEV